MVMLHCLHHLKDEMNFKLAVIHINHGIRGAESDGDAQLVQNKCRELDIPITSKKLTGFDLNTSEEVLRDARYTIFEQLSAESTKVKIATAHHLNDQLETILMRLAKGSAVKGLRGIPKVRENIIRPLIEITHREIEQFAKQNDISYRFDSSNLDQSKLRNQIRSSIVPQIEHVFGSDFYGGFQKSLAAIEQFYHSCLEQTADQFKKIVRIERDRLKFDLKNYKALLPLQRKQLTEYCVSRYYPLNFDFSFKFFQEFDTFVDSCETGSGFHFKHGVRALKDRGKIIFTNLPESAESELNLYPGEPVLFGRNKISLIEVESGQVSFNEDLENEYICGDKIELPLRIRGWKRGDSFYPLGMKTAQKLSNFFINQKISRVDKNKIPLILNKEEIIWIAGLRLDQRYRISDKCRKIFLLKIEANPG